MADAIATLNITNGTGDVTDLFVKVLSNMIISRLRHKTFFTRLVMRDFGEDISEQGRVIGVRKYSNFSVADFTDGTAFVTQELTDSTVDVTLNKHKIIPFSVSHIAELISKPNVNQDYLDYAISPLVEQVESDLMALYSDLTTNTYTATGSGGQLIVNDFGPIRRKIVDAPAPDRNPYNFLISTWDQSKLLQEEKFTNAEWVGGDATAMKQAYVGQLLGFNIFESTLIKTVATSVTTYHNIAFHEGTFAIVTRPMMKAGVWNMPGVKVSTITDAESGLSLRLMISFDHSLLRWKVSVDILYGVKTMQETLGVDVSSSETP